MSDDLDALLTRANAWPAEMTNPADMIDELAHALRECRADYLAALDVIARIFDGPDEMTDHHWRVFCEAARQAHRNQT